MQQRPCSYRTREGDAWACAERTASVAAAAGPTTAAFRPTCIHWSTHAPASSVSASSATALSATASAVTPRSPFALAPAASQGLHQSVRVCTRQAALCAGAWRAAASGAGHPSQPAGHMHTALVGREDGMAW